MSIKKFSSKIIPMLHQITSKRKEYLLFNLFTFPSVSDFNKIKYNITGTFLSFLLLNRFLLFVGQWCLRSKSPSPISSGQLSPYSSDDHFNLCFYMTGNSKEIIYRKPPLEIRTINSENILLSFITSTILV